jgi:N-acetylmuramic acid 6-phosphate etherase
MRACGTHSFCSRQLVLFEYLSIMPQTYPKTEQRLPGLDGFDSWENTKILHTLLDGQRRAIDAVEQAIPAISKAADAISGRLAAGGRLIYAGAGTSIRVAVQDGTELPATFGLNEKQLAYLIAGGRAAMFETLANAEDDVSQGTVDAQICSPRDAMIAIAASGRTPYTIAAAETARKNGSVVVAVVNNAASRLAAAADIEILLDSGPEVISGSTRMGAGTAQKAALNLLSTLVNTRLGAVHDGLMVNVEAGNQKLEARAAGIVSALTGAPSSDASLALAKTGGHVKLAVLLLSGVNDRAAAQQLLSHVGGNLRQALAKVKSKV